MIRYIDRLNRARFSTTMDQLFRIRHDVFVGEKGWRGFASGFYERDQYDTDDASYVVSLDENGDAAGCFRLYPTVLPHMLSETFAHVVDGPIIARPDYLELTRFHLRKDRRGSEPYIELLTAIPEIGLRLGMSGFTAFVRTLRIPVMEEAGLTLTPIGLPQDLDGESHTAIIFEVSEEILARINHTRGTDRSVFELATSWPDDRLPRVLS